MTTLRRPAIRVLDISGTPTARGYTHGRTFAAEIQTYTEERINLVTSGLWTGGPVERGDVIELAASCLPAHEDHNPDLYAEMIAMAEGAGIGAADAVIVGGFTDFVDTVRAELGGPMPDTVIEDDCTGFIVPDDRSVGGNGLFGQTWDMHDSATDYVILLRVHLDDGPDALVFTTCGALGQIGMNEAGVCVGINNLTPLDGQRGVMWTNVVRDALLHDTAEGARDAILGAQLAGAHNYFVFDAHGHGYDIEATPTSRPVTTLGSDAIIHTNHIIAPESLHLEADRSPALQDSSRRRYAVADATLNGPDRASEIDVDDLMALTREPTAVCQHPVAPYHVESAGAVIMRPRTADFWAVWGVPDHNDYEHFTLRSGAGATVS